MTIDKSENNYCGNIVIQILSKISKKNPEGIEDSFPVFGINGVITDSLAILDALFEIEKELQIEIPDEDLTESLFESVSSFITYITNRYRATST